MEIETDNHSYYFVEQRQNETFLQPEQIKDSFQDSLEENVGGNSSSSDNSTLSSKSSETNEELEGADDQNDENIIPLF